MFDINNDNVGRERRDAHGGGGSMQQRSKPQKMQDDVFQCGEQSLLPSIVDSNTAYSRDVINIAPLTTAASDRFASFVDVEEEVQRCLCVYQRSGAVLSMCVCVCAFRICENIHFARLSIKSV